MTWREVEEKYGKELLPDYPYQEVISLEICVCDRWWWRLLTTKLAERLEILEKQLVEREGMED